MHIPGIHPIPNKTGCGSAAACAKANNIGTLTHGSLVRKNHALLKKQIKTFPSASHVSNHVPIVKYFTVLCKQIRFFNVILSLCGEDSPVQPGFCTDLLFWLLRRIRYYQFSERSRKPCQRLNLRRNNNFSSFTISRLSECLQALNRNKDVYKRQSPYRRYSAPGRCRKPVCDL